MVAFHIRRGATVPLSATEFYAGLRERFVERDGMFFLPEQVPEYDRSRLQASQVAQLTLFVSDEKSSVQWLRQQLDPALGGEPQTYQGIQPKFLRQLHQARHKALHELSEMLEQNFLQGEQGRWYVPDPNRAGDLEKLRQRGLLRESRAYVEMIQALNQALSLRAPTLRFDEILVTDGEGAIKVEKRGVRCRYALRFGDEKSADYDGRTRDVDVRVTFSSPFRPFILATTSIGQEGLDFHQYCHRVVHWNIPSNSVDLEQREGRVHRYKGHVIRRNLALRYGLTGVVATNGQLVDPWQQLFQRAVEDRAPDSNDLRPFWIYETEGGYSIERIIPVLPLSREIARMAWLKRSLVAYRSVIGQPRQDELLEYLASRLGISDIETMATELAIDLSPPDVHVNPSQARWQAQPPISRVARDLGVDLERSVQTRGQCATPDHRNVASCHSNAHGRTTPAATARRSYRRLLRRVRGVHRCAVHPRRALGLPLASPGARRDRGGAWP